MRAFLAGVDKRDEKFIINGLKATEFETADRVIKSGTWDRSLLILTDGELIAFSADGENQVYTEGAIIGVEQFLFNAKWDTDIICGQTAVVSKLRWDALQDMVKSNAAAAAKVFKCVMRHYCYCNLYEEGKKHSNQHLFNFKNITDQDLMIDFKLLIKNDKDAKLFSLLSQAGQTQTVDKLDQVETMPYFLTSQFAEVLAHQASMDKKKTEEHLKTMPTQGGGMYKSAFLKNKITQQNDKRKVDKKQPRPKTQSDEKKSGDTKGKGPARKRGENEEELLEIIQELKNELKQRD